MKRWNTSVSDLRNRILNGGISIGTWLQLDCSAVAEILGHCGYDWAAVDLEHGQFSSSRLPDMFRALELGGTLPFARLAQGEPKEIKQVLDAGAKGLIFPMVEQAEALASMISHAYYPPAGQRGVGFSRANLYGMYFQDYRKNHLENLFMVAQVESRKGFENLEQILKVKGLDAIMVGPYDLSGSMGITAQFDHPDFIKCLDTIETVCCASHVALGYHVVQPDLEQVKEKMAKGYQFIAYGTDAVFLLCKAEAPAV